MYNNRRAILIILLFITIATAYEITHLTDISLWHDEAFSGLLVNYKIPELIFRTGLDVHPPFYYLLLKGWVLLLKNTVFSLRLFSVFFSILTVFSLYFLVKEAFKNIKLALFSSLLIALNSFQIQFAMEARMFTLGLFLVVISSFFLLKALKTKKIYWWILYSISAICGIYTHYYIFFSLFGQMLFVLYYTLKESQFHFSNWLKDKNLRLTFTSSIIMVISYLPWLPTFFKQFSQVEQSYWIPPMSASSIPSTLLKMASGGSVDPFKFWYLLVVTVITVLGILFFCFKKMKKPNFWLFLSLFIVPFTGAVLFSLKRSIYLDRYFIFTLPFYLVLITGSIISIKNKYVKNTLIFMAIIGTMVSFPLRWKYHHIDEKPGMAKIANYLNEQVGPSDKIFVGSSFVYFTFKYYNQTNIHPLLYAPGPLLHYSGTALLSPNDIIKNFNKGVKKDDIVWMINTTGFGNYQPEVPNNWKKIDEKGVQDVYDYQGWIIVTKYRVI